jgi:hypothetical protein
MADAARCSRAAWIALLGGDAVAVRALARGSA